MEVEYPPEGDIEENQLQRKKEADFSQLTELMKGQDRMRMNQSGKDLLPENAALEEGAQSEMEEEVDQEEILEKDIE